MIKRNKTAILTYHRSPNLGSVLQTYCTYRLLRERYELDPVILDYRPVRREWIRIRRCISFRRVIIVRSLLNWMRICDKFLEDNCTHTIPIFGYSPFLWRTFLKMADIRTVVVGSDTVWQDVLAPTKIPAPNAYFLPGLRGIEKIAISVSADKTDLRRLNDRKHCDELRRAIEDFNFISFRDAHTLRFLDAIEIEPKRLNFLPDPTILYSFEKVLPLRDVAQCKNSIGVGIADEKIRSEIVAVLKEAGFDVTLTLGDRCNDGTLPPPPSTISHFTDALSRFSRFGALVTDRFHQSICCLKIGRCPVFYLPPKDTVGNGKGADLFGRLGLDKFVLGDARMFREIDVMDEIHQWRTRGARDRVKRRFDEMQSIGLSILDKFLSGRSL